jgi:glutathione synthase/RimK-type ligase-like ATP-grasp enzyme
VILVVGGLADTVTELVCARLEDDRTPYRLLDLGRYPIGYRVRWWWRDRRPVGWIETDNWRLDLESVTAVFARYLGATGRVPLPDRPSDVDQAVRAETDAGVMALIESLPCLVINRLGGGMTNHSKVLQSLLIRRAGLLIPPTLVTTDPSTVRSFIDEHEGGVIYKSLSGMRSIVQSVGPAQLARLDLLRNGPSQFQKRIVGDDVRVHVVGDQVFATRIRSTVVDYRFGHREGREPIIEPATIPAELEAACVRLTRLVDLTVAGIDLKVTPSGDAYCLEVNPSPGFLYYEQRTGQPISLAVADVLRGASAPIREGVTYSGA